ncbi:MAG: GNAT family N-acetyltransferase [Planctomycetia bacterium]|nr:GNAT family N-acetyltransferase [Planctomycetia bacterium]
MVARRRWEGCAEALLAAATERLLAAGVRIAQALLPTNEDASAALLSRHGFRHMADLLFMVSTREQFPDVRPTGPLLFEPVDASDLSRLTAIVEQTYEGTLDCPALGGVRDVRDVLAGYRASGVFDAGRWLMVRRDSQDIGCLLLTDHPEDEQWEIVYAGLVPAARGRGHGATIARYAQWRAKEAGRRQLVLAVDAANAPAVSAYAEAGFVVWDRRGAFLRVFPDRSTGGA